MHTIDNNTYPNSRVPGSKDLTIAIGSVNARPSVSAKRYGTL